MLDAVCVVIQQGRTSKTRVITLYCPPLFGLSAERLLRRETGLEIVGMATRVVELNL